MSLASLNLEYRFHAIKKETFENQIMAWIFKYRNVVGMAEALFSRAKVEITANVFPRVYKFYVLAAAAVVVQDKVVVRPCQRTSVP